jgi:hypothetical protein
MMGRLMPEVVGIDAGTRQWGTNHVKEVLFSSAPVCLRGSSGKWNQGWDQSGPCSHVQKMVPDELGLRA